MLFVSVEATLSPGGGGTPCNGLYEGLPPERGAIFRFNVYERVFVEVYDKDREFCHLGLRKGPKGRTEEF